MSEELKALPPSAVSLAQGSEGQVGGIGSFMLGVSVGSRTIWKTARFSSRETLYVLVFPHILYVPVSLA